MHGHRQSPFRYAANLSNVPAMTQQTENDHPARLLFDLMLSEFRSVVQSEIAVVREEIRRVVQSREILPKANRFYSLKKAAVELNLSEATVRRLIDRGLLRPSKATRHIRIPRDQIDEFARPTM
jgi:excisionase family DNA binding protein